MSTIAFVLVALFYFYRNNVASGDQFLVDLGSINSSSSVTRLPNSTIPRSYRLNLEANLEDRFEFFGRVRIRLLVLNSTREIVMHSKNLEILSIVAPLPGFFWLDPANELLIMNTTSDYRYRENFIYEFEIDYEGYLSADKMIGFYRSSYKIGDETKWLATTHFEPTYARMAFPCFDEPRFKAPFTISIARKSNQVVLSNMPRRTVLGYDSVLYSGRRVWDVFYETPPMATYLVAFVVCDFKNLTNNITEAYAREDAIDDAARMRDIGLKLLDSMAFYTNVSYMLPRLKNIAIPDFEMGAMENWGLITYRETRMMYNTELSSSKDKEMLTATIAHEISHQWFGDYVTPIWWDYLWLNEGFARYFEYILVDKLEPTWRIMDNFVVDRLQYALFVDQAIINHGVTTSVNTTGEIVRHFNAITYQKGASILRMLEHTVGSKTFQKSISKYLKDAWTPTNNGSVTPNDLWNALENTTAKDGIPLPAPITQIMEKWTRNIGYPLVEVSRIPNTNRIKIKQKTYNSSRSATPVTECQWFIPITYTVHCHPKFDNTTPSMWLKPGNEIAFDEKQSPCQDCWIIFNIQATGYYRVNYFTENWYLLIDELKMNHTKIHSLNRAQLIDDSIVLAIDDYLRYEIPFELMKYLDNEEDFIPWSSAITNLKYLYFLYETTQAGDHLKHYVHSRVKNQYQRVGFTARSSDNHRIKTGRTRLVSFACRFGYEPCIEDALAEYNRHSRNYSRIDVDVKKTVLCVALQKSNTTKERSLIFLNLWHLYKRSNVAHERITALEALSCSDDKEILRRYLYKTIDENDFDIRKQDYVYVYRSVFSREKGVTAGLKLIESLMSSMLVELVNNKTLDSMVNMLKKLKNKITTPKQMEILQNIVDLSQELNVKYDSFKAALKKIHPVAIKKLEFISRREEELKMTIGRDEEGHGAAISSSVPSTVLYMISISLLFILQFSILL